MRIVYLLMTLLLFTQCAHQQHGLQGRHEIHKEPVVIRSVKGDYDEVWEALKILLTEKGLVISSVAHVGEMLDRTGKALNRAEKIYGKAKVMEFCSAVLSRNMMEKNPHFIAFCPYRIMVYTFPEEENKVYLSYRRLLWKDESRKDVLEPIEELLEELVKDVVRMQEEFR